MAFGINGGEKLLLIVTVDRIAAGHGVEYANAGAQFPVRERGIDNRRPLTTAAAGDAELSPSMMESVVRTPRSEFERIGRHDDAGWIAGLGQAQLVFPPAQWLRPVSIRENPRRLGV